jgi:hypothetical protein
MTSPRATAAIARGVVGQRECGHQQEMDGGAGLAPRSPRFTGRWRDDKAWSAKSW